MDKYYFIEANLAHPNASEIEKEAFNKCNCLGVEEFSIDEEKVDEILGERSYSGGDVPTSVIDEVEFTVLSESDIKKFYFDSETNANNYLNILSSHGITSTKVLSEELEDWGKKWRESFTPIKVTDTLRIIPSWYNPELSGDVLIYPGQGFGTGNHETTFLCLKLFSDYNLSKENQEILDFGCGSGILGIAARILNPCTLDLYDIDKDALENCKQNLDLNKIESDYKLLLPADRSKIDKKYHIVFANILQNVLLLEANYLANSLLEGGSILLSGLLSGQEDTVIAAFQKENTNLKLVKVEKKGDWVAVLMENQ